MAKMKDFNIRFELVTELGKTTTSFKYKPSKKESLIDFSERIKNEITDFITRNKNK